MTTSTGATGRYSLFDALPDAVLVVTAQPKLVYANKAAATLFPALDNYAPGAMVSRYIRHPAILDLAETVFTDDWDAGADPERFTLPGKVDRRLSVQAAPIEGADADTAGPATALIMLHDETAMWRAEQMRADFIANASHELRTPIASIIGYIETLQGPAKEDRAAHEQFLGIMQDQAQRMSRLIDDLLSLSRIEIDEHMPPSARVRIATIMSKAVDVISPLTEREGVSVDTLIDPALRDAEIVGSEDELVQMLQNLLDNAVKYGSEAGRIEIGAAPDDKKPGNILLSIRDFGQGIPPEHVPRLTERFYRVSAKTSRARGGTGLGLAIVKHIVNRHQGVLRIESTPGEGSCFMASLPLAAKPTAPLVAIDFVPQIVDNPPK